MVLSRLFSTDCSPGPTGASWEPQLESQVVSDGPVPVYPVVSIPSALTFDGKIWILT